MGFANGVGGRGLGVNLLKAFAARRAQDPRGRVGTNRRRGAARPNVQLERAQAVPRPPLLRQHAMRFQPTFAPVRQPSPERPVRLNAQQAGRFCEIAGDDRPPPRAAPARAVRSAVQSAISAANQRKGLSQTFLAIEAFFGGQLAEALNEVRHLISAGQYDATQFSELADILVGNPLVHATSQALYDATAAPDDTTRSAKLQVLADILANFKSQIHGLPPQYNDWITSVGSRIDTVSHLAKAIITGRQSTPPANTEARDPIVRGVLVKTEKINRSHTAPSTLVALQRDLGDLAGAQLYQVKLLLGAVEVQKPRLDQNRQLKAILEQYWGGGHTEKSLASALRKLRRNILQSQELSHIQKQALSVRFRSVESELRAGRTPLSKEAARLRQSLADQIREPVDTIYRARTERHFVRTSLVIPQSGDERAIVPRDAAARLTTLDQICKDHGNLLPTTLQSLFDSAHEAANTHTVEAALDTLKTNVQNSKLRSGYKAEILSLIKETKADIAAHFERDEALNTNAPADINAWLDDHGHAVDANKIQILQNTLALLNVSKAKQTNFVASLSQYLSPDNDTQTQSAYQLLKQDGAALLRDIEQADVDADIKGLARDALQTVITEIGVAKPTPIRTYTPYRARGGSEITPNVLSPGQKPDFDHWATVITTKTGIARNPLRKPNSGDARAIAQIWTKDLVRLHEDFRKKNYGKKRRDFAREGVYGVSMVLRHNALVCRELSVVASALFAEFGIQTQVGAGNVKANTDNPGKHAWLEVCDDSGQVGIIVDSNYKRATFDNFDSYSRACRGATYRQDGGGQQRVVQIQPADLFADMQKEAGVY